MSNKIGIVMGGYIDENHTVLSKTELNKRIVAIQKESAELKRKLDVAVEVLGKLSQSGDGSCKDKKASFFDCLPTLQIEFEERKEFAVEALKQIKEK